MTKDNFCTCEKFIKETFHYWTLSIIHEDFRAQNLPSIQFAALSSRFNAGVSLTKDFNLEAITTRKKCSLSHMAQCEKF